MGGEHYRHDDYRSRPLASTPARSHKAHAAAALPGRSAQDRDPRGRRCIRQGARSACQNIEAFPPASSMTLTVVAGLAAQCVPRGSAEPPPLARAPLVLALPSSPPCRGRTPAPTKPAASFMPRSLPLALLCALCVNACAVVTVAGAAVSVAATAVSVTATVVETTVDVAAAGVGAVVGDDEDEDDED